MRAFEDFPVGTSIPLAPYPVTREEVIAFASEFDPQPFHLDEAAAAESLLGGLAASGWHSCAMMMRMMCDAFVLDSTAQGSPGIHFVKWKRPVRPGDALSGTTTVQSARLTAKRRDLGVLGLRNELVNQKGESVLDSEYAVLILTREGAGL